MDLSIIIVSWNVKGLLEKCLDSIYRQAEGISFEVFVVDNDSRDGSADMVAEKFPQVRLIANKDNKGFAAANNQGIRGSKGEFVLLLNPDTEIVGDALQEIVSYMQTHGDVGVAGCKLLNSDGTLQPSARRFPTLASQVVILTKIHNFLPNIGPAHRYFAMDFDYRKEGEADQVMGAFFMISRSALDRIGLLDEGFFIWFEEVDFCKRVKDAGMKVMYVPGCEIIHHCSQSFAQVLSLKKQKMFNRSLRRYFGKHRPFGEYLLISMMGPASLFLAWLWQTMKGRGKEKGK